MVHLFTARFSPRPRVLREGPFWAIIWAGLCLTNFNLPLAERLLELSRTFRWRFY